MALDAIVNIVDPDTFEYQTYSVEDEQLIVQTGLDTAFSASTDYVEYIVYDQNRKLLYPAVTVPLTEYSVREGDVLLNPSTNLEQWGFDVGIYNIVYSFYRKIGASGPPIPSQNYTSSIGYEENNYFISEISSDRTEIRLDSNTINNEDIISSINTFIQYREEADYFVDFYLNFGLNQTLIANNIKLETEEGIDPTVIIKLLDPLPSNFGLKNQLWLVEILSQPQAYEVDFPFEPIIEDDFTYIAGPNYNLNIIGQTATPSEQFSYNTLLSSDLTSSITQIQSLINEKEININIDYEQYSNFINFSSAKTRLENFYYKVGLIESSSNQILTISQISSNTSTTTSFSASLSTLNNNIDTIIKNFDGYEYFLYFNSGSDYSYPKSNTEPPFVLYPTGSSEVLTWVSSSAASASAYDDDNKDWLYFSIPEYLREDPSNRRYELFVDMVGQYYDNVWVYTKDLTNKFNTDNRLDYGISKDLVADAIRDFAVKLYSNNFNTDDLFTAFLGITPSGSAFPFPNITGSLPTPTGFEYVDTKISASNDIIPLDDVNKRVYKRIYHNIPYLLKTKGTIAGLRALITSYGIPDTILRISEFGGKDRNESQDYDLKQDVFNYAFDTGASATNFVSSSLQANTKFSSSISDNKARTIQLRFKSPTLPLPVNNIASSDIRYSQSLWSTDEEVGNLVLEYTGSGLISGSYSGSIPDPYDTYGTLKWIPAEENDPNLSASVYLPFFNGDWWSVQMNVDNVTASLYAANEIDGKIGFNESSSTVGFDESFYFEATKGFLNKNINVVFDDGTIYTPFSGSFQELRYYVNEISQSHFYDYTVNPYSNEGNGINSTPDQQFFRAALGTQLDTGSRTSIHPRVTGSAVQITQSFATNSEFYINTPRFITNVEDIFQDQVPAGIKNRITDKVRAEKLIIAEAPYGFPNPSASVPEISSTGNDTQTISAMESMQQYSFVSQSYTPNVNSLEIAFSPSNQINDDINAQLGYFNLGEYIGDPRFVSSSLDTYPDLDLLRNAYFEKYKASYNIVDFIRLIKFFDNSLFKMIKDFTPARSSLSSGVVVKQHLLERNRYRPAQVSSSFHDYEGLIVNLPKNYSSGSTDFPQYSTSGSALYKFSGGPGGSFNKFNGLQTYISGSKGLGPDNRFGITQSWFDANDGSILNSTFFNQGSMLNISGSYLGPSLFPKENQSEFYDGIFSGSLIIVTTQSLNPGCDPYLNANDTPVVYKPIFFGLPAEGNTGIDAVVTQGEFLNQQNVPPGGYAWISSTQTNVGGAGQQQVRAIKLSQDDQEGTEVINYLDDFDNLRVILPDAILPYGYTATEYIITGRTIYSDHALLFVSPAVGIAGNNYKQTVEGIDYYAITSSAKPNVGKGGSMNWSLSASTDYSTKGIVSITSDDSLQQGVFENVNATTQEQPFFYFNGSIYTGIGTDDQAGQFTPGGPPGFKPGGEYTIQYTPNVPLLFSASIVYSTSFDENAQAGTQDSGIYHSASLYQGSGLFNQDFFLSPGASSDIAFFYISAAALNAAAADALPTPTAGSNSGIVYVNTTGIIAQLSTCIAGNAQFSVVPITTPPSFYKFASGKTTGTGEDYFVSSVANLPLNGGSGCSSTSRRFNSLSTVYTNPSSGKAMLVGTPVEIDTTFKPAPRYVLDLGDVNFNGNNWNTQIPGNSGSGASMVSPYAGHPKIRDAGTASMDWYFPSLTLAGTQPTLIGGSATASPEPFSASSAQTNNGDFTANFPTTSFGGNLYADVQFFDQTVDSVTYGQQYDGTCQIDMLGIENYINIQQGGVNVDYIENISFRINGLIKTSDTSDTFKVQVETTQANISPVLEINNWSQESTTLTNSSNGEVEYSNNAFTVFYKGTNGTANTKQYVLIRFTVTNNSGADQLYDFTGLSIGAFVSYTDNNGNSNLGFPGSFQYGELIEGVDVGAVSKRFQTIGSQTGTTPYKNLMKNFATVPSYNSAIVDVYLKRTGSDGDLIITGSVFDGTSGGYSGSIYSGSVLNFVGSPFLGINNNIEYDGTDATSGSTRNEIGDLYYIEYSMSNLSPGFNEGQATLGQHVTFQTDSDLSTIEITQSTGGGAAGGTFNATGSFRVRKTNSSLTDISIANSLFDIPTVTANTRVDVEVPYEGAFFHDDSYQFTLGLNKVSLGSGIVIKEFTGSIYPSQSLWADIKAPFEVDNYRAPLKTDFIIPTFYGANVLPFNLALDCQPLLNNFILGRKNTWLMRVDYTNESGPIIPVNQAQLLSGSAVRASVPDSNYTQLSSILPKYNGAKSTSQELNVWNVGDVGTFGKNPTIELKDAFFGYFNDISDPYPNINDLTQVNLNYLIDEQGNALPPSLEDKLSIDTFEQVFPNNTLGRLAIKDGKNKYSPLATPAPISRIMEYVTPICYSQNAGNNYSNTIPLSGSGYISRYDNDDDDAVEFAQFMAAGTSSIVDVIGEDQLSVSYYLDPTETNVSPAGASSPYTASTSGAGFRTGSASYPAISWGLSAGDDLAKNSQIVSVQHSVVTSYVSETGRVRDELDLTFLMFTGSDEDSQKSFNLEGIDCKVYTDTGQVYLLKDVDDYGWFTYTNLPTTVKVKKRKKGLSFKRWYYTRVPIPGGGIKCKVDWEMFETLFDLGLMRQRKPKNGAGVQALEWIFRANSGNHVIKQDEKISWKFEGSFKNAKRGYRQGFFFPSAYTGAYTPAMIKGQGALDYLLDNANTATAPFWQYTGSGEQNFIEMLSPNFNEAYGTGFYQGDLPYEPGFSEYFPGNTEPKTTSFDPIENVLLFEEGDEIRFGNNESFTYKVLEVFAPSENVNSNVGKIKLRLDKPIDTTVNKDFFLIRRIIASPQSLYLDSVFPYGILSSGSIFKGVKSGEAFALTASTFLPDSGSDGNYSASISDVEAISTPGILYSDFPTDYLIESASIIVNDLISKGIIES